MVRRAILRVSPEVLFRLHDGELFRVECGGIPRDAKMIGARYNSWVGDFEIHLESSEFAEVPDGQESPVLKPPIFRSIDAYPCNRCEPEADNG